MQRRDAARAGDPIDALLGRAIAAVESLGRGDGRASVLRFAVLAAARGVAPPGTSVEAIAAALFADVAPSLGGATLGRLYLAVDGPPAGEATERRIEAWRQALVRQCRPRASYELRVPEHADAEALWHAAADADGAALVVSYMPAADAGTPAALLIAARRDDASHEATIERRPEPDAREQYDEPRDAVPLVRVIADGLCEGGAARIDWVSRDRRWRCAVRRQASDPVGAALALLQRVSGYPVGEALADGNVRMTLAIDSIMAMEYAERFRAAFGRRLPVEALLDRPPLETVVGRIRACLAQAGNDDVFVPLGRQRAVEGTL